MIAHSDVHTTTNIIDLHDVEPSMIDRVGGKAAGLGRLLAAGERVPDGFCLTTAAHRSGMIPQDDVLAAYRRLGGGPVAVRSSATAEDLADASFAGQQDSYLNVRGDEALIDAIRRCWASLDNERAVAYRAEHHADQDVAMAVVVQRMIEPRVAGVMFTANPITGTRTEVVVDAITRLGDVVVDGSAASDHYVLPDGERVPTTGCLTADDLERLRRTGRRVERHNEWPQDIEWAIDADDVLWLLQSRPITTLFPVPADSDPDDLRVYLEVGHLQGLRQPTTPMGMSVLVAAADQWFEDYGLPGGGRLVAEIAGRMFLDLTTFVRNPRMRDRMVDAMDIYGPSVKRALQVVIDDPRLAPRKATRIPVRTAIGAGARILPKMIMGVMTTAAHPAAARTKAFRIRDQVRDRYGSTVESDAADRIARATTLQKQVLTQDMTEILPQLWVGLGSRAIAERLLTGVSEPGELDGIGRGMPYNVTTAMDLALWAVATRAVEYRSLFLDTPAERLAELYRDGGLPDIGLSEFLAEYGHRSAAEVDVGVPRWAEDPAPVFAALSGYLRVTDRHAAPDARFEQARAEAEETLDRLIGRAVRRRPLRALLAGLLLRRWRDLAGLRELPKFIWLYPLRDVRQELLLAGSDLARLGRLDRAEDIMFLTLDEAALAAAGTDHREVVGRRRAEHVREWNRQQVPGLLLSDGTMPQALPDPDAIVDSDPDRLVGMPAAAGRATGTVRVVQDPSTARVEPGDILVAPTTDPGWTPLFLTAGGLVTETGSPMAHGPTVAREYGIPAVICVPEATTRLITGQTVTVDGASGVVWVNAVPRGETVS